MKTNKTILLFFLACLAVTGCSRSQFQQAEGMVWGTVYHIVYSGDPALADSALIEIDRVGASLNVFDTLSLVSRVNRNATDSCDGLLCHVIEKSQEVHRLSGGYFDPTLGPLIQAWGFGKGHTATADTCRIDELLETVGIDRVNVAEGRIVKPDERMEFNFSAIAKGLGCDLVADKLVQDGAADCMVEIGGEIAVRGKNPEGKDWRISIDCPKVEAGMPSHESQTVIAVSDCGVATSGNYRNFHGDGDARYGHTLSPFTGRPATTDVLSVTVVAPTAMEADALATACMAMGSQNAREMLGKLQLAAMMVLSDWSVWATPQFRELEIAAENR